MGGAPGTRETDLLSSDKLVTQVDALVLSGGSALGLDAASGVADALRAGGRGYEVAGQRVPIVPAAIIFDLLNGGDKNWATNPYSSLGQQALAAACTNYKLGSAGAGFGALTPTVKGGLGSASLQFSLDSPNTVNGEIEPVTVAALAVANPIGSVTVPGAGNFWAAPFERDDEFGGLGFASMMQSNPLQMPAAKPLPATAETGTDRSDSNNRQNTNRQNTNRQNTTLVIVATDANLNVSQLKRMAVASQDGLARAIYPAHTPMDGDVVFALSTTHGYVDKQKAEVTAAQQLVIGHAASACVSRAIARAVFEASPQAGDLLPAWREKYGGI